MSFNPLVRLFTHIIPVLPVLRRIVLMLLREFTGYGAPGMRPENPQPQQAEREPLQQLLRQNELLVQALQRSRVRQRITLWISLAALLIACLLWFRVA